MDDNVTPEGQEAPHDDHDVERQAREMGWAPKEHWRGRPEDFVDAHEFVERGKRVLPIVRSQVDRERAERIRVQTELQRTREDFDRRTRALEAMHRRTLETQRAQLVSDFETQKRNAAALGDTQAYDQIVRREQDAYHRIANEENSFNNQIDGPSSRPNIPQDEMEEALKFAGRNPWFSSDPGMRMEAEALHVQLRQNMPHLPIAENLRAVEDEIKRRHAAKFGIQPQDGDDGRSSRSSYQAVEGSTNSRSGARAGRGYRDLPAEAKSACDEMIARGYLKGDKAKEQYAAQYWSEYGG